MPSMVASSGGALGPMLASVVALDVALISTRPSSVSYRPLVRTRAGAGGWLRLGRRLGRVRLRLRRGCIISHSIQKRLRILLNPLNDSRSPATHSGTPGGAGG